MLALALLLCQLLLTCSSPSSPVCTCLSPARHLCWCWCWCWCQRRWFPKGMRAKWSSHREVVQSGEQWPQRVSHLETTAVFTVVPPQGGLGSVSAAATVSSRSGARRWSPCTRCLSAGVAAGERSSREAWRFGRGPGVWPPCACCLGPGGGNQTGLGKWLQATTAKVMLDCRAAANGTTSAQLRPSGRLRPSGEHGCLVGQAPRPAGSLPGLPCYASRQPPGSSSSASGRPDGAASSAFTLPWPELQGARGLRSPPRRPPWPPRPEPVTAGHRGACLPQVHCARPGASR